jgi:hypothetical protein
MLPRVIGGFLLAFALALLPAAGSCALVGIAAPGFSVEYDPALFTAQTQTDGSVRFAVNEPALQVSARERARRPLDTQFRIVADAGFAIDRVAVAQSGIYQLSGRGSRATLRGSFELAQDEERDDDHRAQRVRLRPSAPMNVRDGQPHDWSSQATLALTDGNLADYTDLQFFFSELLGVQANGRAASAMLAVNSIALSVGLQLIAVPAPDSVWMLALGLLALVALTVRRPATPRRNLAATTP